MRFSNLEDKNNRWRLPGRRKGMRRLRKIQDVREKIHAKARKMLQHVVSNYVWAGSGERFAVATKDPLEVKRKQKVK